MSTEAMKQALEALETLDAGDTYKTHNAATALRQAIEQAEMVKKGTKAWADTPDDWVDDLRGGEPPPDHLRGATKKVWELCQAIEQAEKPWVKTYAGGKPNYTTPVHASDISAERVDEKAKLKHEPVAWIKDDELAFMSAAKMLDATEWKTNLGLKPEHRDVPLYTAPPKREWVGLTDHELQVLDFNDPERGKLARAVEAKLKEKNNA
jgi:hypothetical protein